MPTILHTFIRQTRIRPRLGSSMLFALVVALSLPTQLAPVTRSLLAWDSGTLLYLSLAALMFRGATPLHMRARAAGEDEGAWIVLLLVIAAGIASVAAIVLELTGVKDVPRPDRLLHLALGITTITCSWGFVHTSFALHYAHEYYMTLIEGGQPALQFPEQRDPDYWDFMYFSFVLAMTSQTSDVCISSRTMRRLALLHGVIAFFFNATLLALAVNTAAGIL
jgi:uncharacterized membrane protein